ncbi:MAG TPA: Gfo/Idh/MocA family oxidoreductase [Armatimonadaceae bacterium]|nr:Gfo/Idh/MocA family oxidoreductase [Armatimonadaceae bacterium]
MSSEGHESSGLTRREMLRHTGGAAAGVGLLAAGLLPRPASGAGLGSAAHEYGVTPAAETAIQDAAATSANEKVVIALIGAGGQGRSNMRGLMNKPGVEVAAVCDPDKTHMAQAAKMVQDKFGKRPDEIEDFRRVLERKDIDAVIVATPDHWHALPTIYACQAGKDVHCEKPISHNIMEGRAMVNAAQRNKRVVQVNTWQRSGQHFIDAINYVRSGKLGKINVCRAWKVQDPKAATMGNQTTKPVPPELNYDLWVGPAAWEPYQENRCHYNFRWYFNYAGGMTGDWGVHMIDVVLLGMSKDNNLVMPTRVASYGGKLYTGADDDRTAPDTQIAIYEFPGWMMQWEVHVGGQGLDGGRDHGALFIGSEGRLLVDRSGWTLFDPKGQPVEKPKTEVPRVGDHNDDFLTCMKTRSQPRSDIASMHQTTTVCHLANLAYQQGGAITWDPAREVVTNDKKAMNHLSYQRPYRKPWSLPKG